MRCIRCGNNNAKYELELFIGLRKGKQQLCEECYRLSGLEEEDAVEVRILPVKVCAFCGGTVEDCLRTGLVGCAECYSTFWDELFPHIERAQAGTEHRGKMPPSGEKYPLALKLNELIEKRKAAEAQGDTALCKKLTAKIAEWEVRLFGDGE